MITLFRRLRKSLIETGSVQKYILYAIGEILLVMIGILLALQVNNWNEHRKTREVEKAYLLSLQAEFMSNIGKLENTMTRNTSNADYAVELTKHTKPGTPTLDEKEVGKLIFRTISGEIQYRPSSGVLDEIISSGKLGIFSNDSLRNALSSWSGLMLTVRFQEQEHAHYRNELIRILNSRGNPRKAFIDAFGEIMDLTTSKFDNSTSQLLSDHDFDAHLVGFIVTARWLNSRYYQKVEDHTTDILRWIQVELEEL